MIQVDLCPPYVLIAMDSFGRREDNYMARRCHGHKRGAVRCNNYGEGRSDDPFYCHLHKDQREFDRECQRFDMMRREP